MEECDKQVLQTGNPFYCETVLEDKEGRHFDVIVNKACFFDSAGKPAGTVGVVVDITGQKRVERELQESHKRLEMLHLQMGDHQKQLVQSDKMASIGHLAAGIAHEIGNPLGAIIGYVELGRRSGEGESEWVRGISHEASRIDVIMRGLLDYARPRSPVRHRVEINRTLLKALERSNLPRNVELIVQPADNLPSILADPDQLGQVFGNIIQNADRPFELYFNFPSVK